MPPKTDEETWAERRARALAGAEAEDRARAMIGSHPETFMVGRKVRQVRADIDAGRDVRRGAAAIAGGLCGFALLIALYFWPWVALIVGGVVFILLCAMLAAAWADGR